MSKKIIVWLIAVAMIMGCMSFVSGEEPEITSGGAISGISETTYANEQIARTDIVDVSLPNDLPVDIVIFTGTGEGVVMSSDFLITNNGAFSVDVSVCDAHVTVANEDAFSVRPDKNLPVEDNNIYIDMICDADAESGHTVLGTESGGENFRFALESGASGAFRFEGVVNEHGDMKWEDTTVTISLRFEITITGAEAVSAPETDMILEEPAILEDPAIPENPEEATKESEEEAVSERTEETPAENIDTVADGEEEAVSGPTDGAPSEEENGSLPPDGEPVVPETPDTSSTEDAATLPDAEREVYEKTSSTTDYGDAEHLGRSAR
jgi:hypothetical protein